MIKRLDPATGALPDTYEKEIVEKKVLPSRINAVNKNAPMFGAFVLSRAAWLAGDVRASFAPSGKKGPPDIDFLIQETTKGTGGRLQEKVSRVLEELNDSTMDDVGPIPYIDC